MSQVQTSITESQQKIEPARWPEQEPSRQEERGAVQFGAPQVAYRRVQMNHQGLAADLLTLQRTVGNRGVQRILARRIDGANGQQYNELSRENSGSEMHTNLTPVVTRDSYEENAYHTPGEPVQLAKPGSIALSISSSVKSRSMLLRQTPPTSPTVTGREARAVGGEAGMGFAGYRAEEGWAFLTGPGGSAGHRWNEPGFDGVAFRTTGAFEIHILDNKSLARSGNVSSATAITNNLLKNLDDLIATASQTRFDDVPRIQQVRSSLQSSRSAVASGQPLPANVRLIVTNFGGRSTGVTSRLAAQGITFRDLMAPSSSSASSGGGSAPSTPSSGATASSQGNQGRGRGGRGSTTATVGVPETRVPEVGGPSASGQAKVAGLTLAFQGINILLNWINSEIQEQRVRTALVPIEAEVANVRRTTPSLGVLLIFFYSRVEAPSESLIQPGAVFSHIETAVGLTRDEAEQRWRNTPALRAGGNPGTSIQIQQVWIPPLQPAGISAIQSPFPRVAIGTFAAGRAVLQDVEWGGVTGFDDEGQTLLSLQAGTTPQFLILKLPPEIVWFNGTMRMTTSIPGEERAAAEGGNVPVVNLDPIMPFSNVGAACIFPADDATAALFGGSPPTRDNLNQLGRFVNFARARWARPENIKVIRRL